MTKIYLNESYFGGRGRGYNWSRGMSVNAVSAYDNGERPLSKWTKDAFYEELSNETDDDIAKILISLPLTALKEIFLVYSSYHHTSKYFNTTDFYKIRSGVENITLEDAKNMVVEYKKYKVDMLIYNKEKNKLLTSGTTIDLEEDDSAYELRIEPYMMKEKGDGIYVETRLSPKNIPDMPKEIYEFFTRAKDKGLSFSMSGNAYISGEKPISADVINNTERVCNIEDGIVLQRYDKGWRDIVSYEGYTISRLEKLILGEKLKKKILEKPYLPDYCDF